MTQPHLRVTGRHAFAIGNKVRLAVAPSLSNARPGPYTIVALLPERDGVFQYRIKSDGEPYQRIVKEDQLRRE